MSRALIVINTAADRERAAALAFRAKPGTRIEHRDPARSSEDNAHMWVLLTALSRQLVWHGQSYAAETWKDYFMVKLNGVSWMPDEDGGMVPVGRSSSPLSVEEHRKLRELIKEFALRQGIEL